VFARALDVVLLAVTQRRLRPRCSECSGRPTTVKECHSLVTVASELKFTLRLPRGVCDVLLLLLLLPAGTPLRWDSVAANNEASQAARRPTFRATVATDEGPAVLSVLEALQLEGDCCLAAVRDPLHRLCNSTALGVDYHPTMRHSRESVRRVFKLSRGPWHRATFGHRLQEAGSGPFSTSLCVCLFRGECHCTLCRRRMFKTVVHLARAAGLKRTEYAKDR
jgi:hypothetical protein